MTAPTNILSFEHWVAVRAWIDAGADPKVVLSRIGLTHEAFQAAERVYVADLTDESTRGDQELSVRFERVYDGAMASQTSLFAADDDEGPTVPRALASRAALPTAPTTVDVTERLERHPPPPVGQALDQTVLLPSLLSSETAFEAPSESTGGILSHRILPFLEDNATPEQPEREVLRPPPLDADADEIVTLVAPPSRALLQNLAQPTGDAEAAPSSARTMMGPRPTTLEDFAALLRALRNKEPRAEVLARHGLTDSALAAMALVWRERLRRDRGLFESFRELMQAAPGD